MFTKIIYTVSISLLLLSLYKDKEKSKKALKKAWKSFESMLPQLLSVLFIIGITLAFVSPEFISKVMGSESGIFGMLIGGVIGSITMMPSFVAFPLAAALLDNGAGLVQVSAFVLTLTMVGVAILPMEMKVLGRKGSLLRNGLAFGLSFMVAIAMGRIV